MPWFDVEQTSDDWHKLRRGRATSSCFDRIITPKKRAYSAAAGEYIAEIIGEAMSLYGPERPETYMSSAVRHGKETEEQARNFLAMKMGLEVTNGGIFISECGRWAASPDGCAGEDGLIELKCPMAKTHAKYLIDGGVPVEYFCQVQGQLYVSGRKHVWFGSYHPGLPPHIVKVVPDHEFFGQLRDCLELFWADYQLALEKIKAL